jgi:hypothetical protein
MQEDFENVGQVRKSDNGKSLVVQIYADKTITEGEILYINLPRVKDVIAGKLEDTTIARRIAKYGPNAEIMVEDAETFHDPFFCQL